ncbi:MAG TPA: phosphate ABC transporter permease subunit PstC, partial [Actinoplanes sp.]|nr:phosphate ABC transporter permease subunit PstC [Actinoplanes sp.]
MGEHPSRSENASAGGRGVTRRHSPAAGTGVSPGSYDEPPFGGGGALPKKARFSMESGFRGLSVAAGAMVLVIIVAIAVFLISKAAPALSANTENFFTYQKWFPNDADPNFGIAALAFGT